MEIFVQFLLLFGGALSGLLLCSFELFVWYKYGRTERGVQLKASVFVRCVYGERVSYIRRAGVNKETKKITDSN